MTAMADRTVRGEPERSRIEALTLSALNATVERLAGGLDHLEGTLAILDDLAKRLIVLVEPMEAIVDRIDDIVSLGETVMSPLSVTEHAIRGMLDRLRNRAVR
ncbi:ATPase [Mycobacterium simiae]|uniref:ATPase n=1 Tax=Mycobacterium simiae TaxID=1784 RepID=A0A5B1BQT4_MYCSI|nr:ATPase [Mycobacterium simiae]KAA1250155.1 ATPase [Mycobacterium simiae]